MSLERFSGKVAIVTGASSGIGWATCEHLVKNGINVVGWARRTERLKELAEKLSEEPGKFYPLTVDLSSEKDIKSAFAWMDKNLVTPTILINNAGVLANTNLTNGDTSEWKRIFDVNVIALCICTREVIKRMKKSNINGHIININSILGHEIIYYPQLGVYGASKYAVTNITETLRRELTSENCPIKISSVSPGPVDTEVFSAADIDFPPPYRKQGAFLKAKDVSDSIAFLLSTPPSVNIRELTIYPILSL